MNGRFTCCLGATAPPSYVVELIMDSINTKVGLGIAKESASMLTNNSFASSNVVGMSSGVSDYTKSENAAINQQVKNAEKTPLQFSEQQLSTQDKKLKANQKSADTLAREENVSFSESLNNISEFLQTNGTKLSFSMNEDSQQPVVTVSDKESGNVIRQIPSEEMQKFAARIRELESESQSVRGLVIDRQA